MNGFNCKSKFNDGAKYPSILSSQRFIILFLKYDKRFWKRRITTFSYHARINFFVHLTISEVTFFFCTRIMKFDRTKRVSHSLSFRHSIALFKVFLHSFKNETIFDTKYSKSWHASYFIRFKDFLKD